MPMSSPLDAQRFNVQPTSGLTLLAKSRGQSSEARRAGPVAPLRIDKTRNAVSLDRPFPPLPQARPINNVQTSIQQGVANITPAGYRSRRYGTYKPRDTPFPDPEHNTVTGESDPTSPSVYSRDSWREPALLESPLDESFLVPGETEADEAHTVETNEQTTLLCFTQGKYRAARVLTIDESTEEAHEIVRMVDSDGNDQVFVEDITDRLIVPQ